MLKIQEIRELIKLIDDSSIDEFKYEQNGAKVSLKKFGGQTVKTSAPAPQAVEAAAPQAAPSPAPQPEKQSAPSEEQKPESSQSSSDQDDTYKITSPMVGTFYSSPSPESDPYVAEGDTVKKDSVVCIVEAMKLMNEIEAEVNGRIVKVLVENGELVEYGQELFLVEAE
ncbi:acetyl-CoA carboxylase biotin carboxyl carrier protein [Alkalicoccus luteus]|uniref:Biotin carboxyl carrier protein of acetyl-CoA carboxylase n=1 Tax=Alkalicoccus luteus TaxID=1237094 RepID=A0A969PTJ1_9BACI|nr:acetyl-CoA carboxylase biotin carboxyl carrier protein [Alkalicoccus luteus]NJP37638.1 acetyl-CoA carboxylase biotin carboxyl carrier protein [Alkalicoccus luteus]